MKKLLIGMFLSSSLLFASSSTTAFVGIFTGKSSDDYAITVNSQETKYSESDSFGMLRLGANINDFSRVYYETYSFRSEDGVDIVSLQSLNFDVFFGGKKNFLKPILGMSILQKKYASTTNSQNVEVKTNNLSFRAGLQANITDNLELEIGAMQSFFDTDQKTNASNASSEDPDTFWYYFGLTIKFQPSADFISVR